MIIIGIDPGTAKLGYGIVELSEKNAKLIKCDTLTTPAGVDQHLRLKSIYEGITALIKEFSPTTMVIEKLFFNTNAKTAIHVGQARGVSMLAAANKKLTLYEYTALEAKLVLTGYGRSDKKQMQEAVQKYFNLPQIIKSDDANDAVAMALCYFKKNYGD